MTESSPPSTRFGRLCRNCGYDLRGLPGGSTCPECGSPNTAGGHDLAALGLLTLRPFRWVMILALLDLLARGVAWIAFTLGVLIAMGPAPRLNPIPTIMAALGVAALAGVLLGRLLATVDERLQRQGRLLLLGRERRRIQIGAWLMVAGLCLAGVFWLISWRQTGGWLALTASASIALLIAGTILQLPRYNAAAFIGQSMYGPWQDPAHQFTVRAWLEVFLLAHPLAGLLMGLIFGGGAFVLFLCTGLIALAFWPLIALVEAGTYLKVLGTLNRAIRRAGHAAP